MYLPEGVLLRFNSRESVDWLMPTIRAISFLAVFLCSDVKICNLSFEVSVVFHRLEPMENRWIFCTSILKVRIKMSSVLGRMYDAIVVS